MSRFEPRIAFQQRMFKPQKIFDPHLANIILDNTAFTALAYGFGAVGKLAIYKSDNARMVDIDELYTDAVNLALGVYTIFIPHTDTCKKLICNCKIH